jgi:hypothetical protein
MHDILKNALQYNRFVALFSSQCFMFEAWKQMMEVTLIECYEYIRFHIQYLTILNHSLFNRQTGLEPVLYDLLNYLLEQQNSEYTRIPLAALISGAVMSLMAKLREQKMFMLPLVDGSKTKIYNKLKDSSILLDFGVDLPVDQLHKILISILGGILRNGTTQVMRGNLYTTLLNYLE